MASTLQDIDQFQLDLGQGSEIGMAIALSVMMFSVALGLKPEHFIAIKKSPKAYLNGVMAQLLGLPALTLLLAHLLNPLPSVALGMILVACCPGGNVSNMLVLLARGDTALSVSLTATSSLAVAFITPLSILFWSSLYPPTANLLNEIDFDALGFLLQTSVILALPLLLGMLLLTYQSRLAHKIRQPLVILSTLVLLGIIITACARYWELFLVLGSLMIGLVALHNACAFLLGYLTGRLIGASDSQRRALTFEVGIQNSGLGIVILLTQMGGLGGTAAIAGLWGVWHILAGLIIVAVFRCL